MSKYLLIFFLTLFSFSNSIFSQSEIGLHFLDVMQTSKTNPAWVGEDRIQIGLPNIHLNYYNTAGDFNGLIREVINGAEQVSIGDALNDLSETGNILRGGIELNTFEFGYKLGNIRLGLSHSQKVDLFIDYPQTLAKLFLEGNGQFVGQTIDLGHQINLTGYNEFALSGAMNLSKLTIGAKLKYLTGIANASVGNNALTLFTDSDIYQLSLMSDYTLNTSSLINADDLSTFRLEFENFSGDNLFTKNNGIALDLGVTFQLNEKIKVAASVIDLGTINWTENLNNYSSTGNATYDGYDFTEFSTNDEIDFSNGLDTLEEVFNFSETQNEYSTTLPTKIYLSATYNMNERWQLGGLLFTEIYQGKTFPMLALSGQANISDKISIGGIYSAREGNYFNLGLNFAVRLGPVQIYGTSDNILGVFAPYQSSNVNLRTGLNLLF